MLQHLFTYPLPDVTLAHAGDAIENAGGTPPIELKKMLSTSGRGILESKIIFAYILRSQLKQKKSLYEQIQKKSSRIEDLFTSNKKPKTTKM